MDTPLTDEQREMAEKNHDLLLKFLHQNHLSFEEYYDFFAIYYTRAITTYDPTRARLSTYIYATLNLALMSLNRKLHSEKTKFFNGVMSLDSGPIGGKNEYEAGPGGNNGGAASLVRDESINGDAPVNSLYTEELVAHLKKCIIPRYYPIVDGILAGKTHTAIAEETGIHQTQIGILLKTWEKYFYKDENGYWSPKHSYKVNVNKNFSNQTI